METDMFLILLVFAFLLVIQTSAMLAMNKRLGELVKTLPELGKQLKPAEKKKPKVVTPEELLKLYIEAHPELKGEEVQIKKEEVKQND